jgi:hypothetical protein
MKQHTFARASAALLYLLLLASCSGAPAPATPTPARPAIPVITPTPTRRPTQTPKATATATPNKAGEVLVSMDVKNVPAEIVAAMNSVKLTEDDGMRWTYSKEHGKYGKMDENGELKYVVYQMQYFVNGKETIVNMPMHVSSTDGGAMTLISGIAQGDGEHGAWVVKGTDKNARDFFKWVTNDELWKQQNPFLMDALAKVAKGELDIEFVFADTNLLPASLKAALAENKGIDEPKIFGQETAWMKRDDGILMHIYPQPFIKGNKLIIFQLRNTKYLNVHEPTNPTGWGTILAEFLREAGVWGSKKLPNGETGEGYQFMVRTGEEFFKYLDISTISIK